MEKLSLRMLTLSSYYTPEFYARKPSSNAIPSILALSWAQCGQYRKNINERRPPAAHLWLGSTSG